MSWKKCFVFAIGMFTAVLLQQTVFAVVVPPPLACGSNGSEHRQNWVEVSDATRPEMVQEVLRGEKARNHLRALRARNPEVFGRSAQRLEERGYKPTEQVVVYRAMSKRLAEENDGTSSVYPAATTQSSYEGEVTFWSWDDGDDLTWEGTIHVVRYSDGAWRTMNGQQFIGSNQYSIWAETTGASGDFFEDHRDIALRRQPGPRMPGPTFAVQRGLSSSVRLAQEGDFDQDQRTVWDWDMYWNCVASRCGVACHLCAGMGPLYPECWVTCCVTTGLIGCAIEVYIYWN